MKQKRLGIPTEKNQTYLITIAYDGTLYGGWQIQPNTMTIQEVIEEKLALLFKTKIKVAGQGRTDAGVHALAQTAHFKVPYELDSYRFLKAMNTLLPKAIRLLKIEAMEENFHARFSAKNKTYHYFITTDPVILPFDMPYRWHLYYPVDLNLIRKAAHHFLGKHNFSSFANSQNQGAAKNDPIKTITHLEIAEEPGGFRVEISATGFLYKMVRNIVGTLIEVGRKKLEPDVIPEILAAKDRTKGSYAAPPHGLFLIRVDYLL